MSGDDDQPAADQHSGSTVFGTAAAEPDPEADLPDPERDLPSVPSVDVPAVETDESDVPGDLLVGFWTTVVVINVAVLALSVGAMMLAFGVERPLGAGLLAVGLLSLFRGYRKYRSLEARQAARRDADEAPTSEPTTSETTTSETTTSETTTSETTTSETTTSEPTTSESTSGEPVSGERVPGDDRDPSGEGNG